VQGGVMAAPGPGAGVDHSSLPLRAAKMARQPGVTASTKAWSALDSRLAAPAALLRLLATPAPGSVLSAPYTVPPPAGGGDCAGPGTGPGPGWPGGAATGCAHTTVPEPSTSCSCPPLMASV
jgi:hypothetical protein